MIRHYKKPLPRNLELKFELERNKEKLKKFFDIPPSRRRQKKFEFNNRIFFGLKRILIEQFHGKCAYCESIVKATNPEVENFRPKNGSKDFKEFFPDHYGWLAYEWKNIYLSCTNCNRFKGSYFPVKGERAFIGAPYKEVLKEINLIIDPGVDSPDEHISFDMKGRALPLSLKGETTIEILRLNRPQLVKERRTQIISFSRKLKLLLIGKKLNQSIKHYLPDIFLIMENNSRVQFSGALRSCLINFIKKERTILGIISDNLPSTYQSFFFNKVRRQSSKFRGLTNKDRLRSLQKTISQVEKLTESERDVLEKVYLKRIEIKNFKGITSLKFDFPLPMDSEELKSNVISREPWIMLLGENGVGKSAVLQAIALTLIGRKALKHLNITSSSVINNNADEGYVKIFHHGNSKPFYIRFSKEGRIVTGHETSMTQILGYGSSRLAAKNQKEDVEGSFGNVHIKNLFDPTKVLVNANKWLVKLSEDAKKSKEKRKLFDWVGLAIKDLLLLGNNSKLVVENNVVKIRHSKRSAETLQQLSDGYQSIITVAVDIIRTLLKDKTTMETAQGIVLVDELETHLHPRWKMQVVSQLRKVFPKIQFIATTHDPLCLRGLQNGEVVVLYKNLYKKVKIFSSLPDPTGMNAEQLLNSQYFGLSSTYDYKDEERFNEYYYLLSRTKLSRQGKQRRNELKDFVHQKQKVGNNQYEILLNNIINRELANSKFIAPKREIEISEDVLKKIKKVLY
jgi:uncharacterized protein (TIGR02646 family)